MYELTPTGTITLAALIVSIAFVAAMYLDGGITGAMSGVTGMVTDELTDVKVSAPVKDFNKNSIGKAVYGVDRDGGSREHKGIDIFAKEGSDVYSVSDGTVLRSGLHDGGYGYFVEIKHGDYSTLYAHLKENPIVKQGDHVRSGEKIGIVGNTGNAANTPSHVHFELRPLKDKGGNNLDDTQSYESAYDPQKYIYALGSDISAWNDAFTGDKNIQIPKITIQPSCFLGSTKVLLDDMTLKKIEDISQGDSVLSFLPSAGETVPSRVSRVFSHVENDYLVVNGKLRVTPYHVVYAKRGG